MKKIILILLPLALAFAPISMSAQTEHESIETSVSGVTVVVKGNTVRITGAADEVLEIFKITGQREKSIRIDNADKTISLNLPKGCYLLKIGKVVRKVSIE